MGRPKGSKNKAKSATAAPTALPTPTQNAATSESSRFVWTEERVEYLLQLRLEDYRSAFSRNNSTAQIKVIWAEITVRFNLLFSTTLEASSLQTKFQKLKGEYNDGMHDEQKTGNDGTPLKDSIPYWDILVSKFQGKDGYGICFGDSEESSETTDDFLNWAATIEDEDEVPSEESSTADENGGVQSDEDATQSDKRKKEVQDEVDNQRKRRKEQKTPTGKQAAASEISTGLVYLGDSLREGLRSSTTATDNETKDLLNQMVKGQAELTSCLKSFLENFRFFPPPPPPPSVS
jgi:hypothetical protein